MNWLVELVEGIPPAIAVMLLAFSPVGEVRVSIPVAMLVYDMGWGEAIVWSLIGNLAVAPVAAWLYVQLERILRRGEQASRWLDRLFERTRTKNSARVERMQEAAVALFIAIPIPGSGAWTGVLVAHVFGLTWKKAWSYYYSGVVIATFLVAVLVQTGRWAL
ncbi:MAG: COG2426 family protein [Thermoplasmatota archaeon]